MGWLPTRMWISVWITVRSMPLGENGAGKSTLMKMLFGLEKIDKGEVLFEGKPIRINSPAEAIKLKIGMVHQEFMLVPSLTVS